jgi:hypothetical protein
LGETAAEDGRASESINSGVRGFVPLEADEAAETREAIAMVRMADGE